MASKELKKYQYSVYKQETGSAGGKAKNDAYDVLLKCGFKPTYKPSRFRPIRIIQQLLSFNLLNKHSIVVIQYPSISPSVIKLIRKKLCKIDKKIAIVHDIQSIQGMGNVLEKEMNFLNMFDVLIVHNPSMKQYLIDIGYKGELVVLGIFDYLHDLNIPTKENEFSNTVCFAGNLDKSSFVATLKDIKCNFNLYGIKNKTVIDSDNCEYKGLLSSEQIVYELVGDYGLVWDGNSLDSCDGIYGKYLLYNCPHKLSCYLSANKPVIVWDKSAAANFVKENGIGVTISSINELNKELLIKNFATYKKNVLNIKKKLAEGYFMTQAINEAIRKIYG